MCVCYIIPQIGVNAEINSTSASYSSIHIVTRVSQQTTLKHHKSPFYIPVEIQIRTVFEDAWGEIDHKYGYVIRSGKEAGKPVANTVFIQEHLKVLKKFSDACSEYADIIYAEASPTITPPNLEGKVLAVGADDDILTRFTQLEVPDRHIDSYITGRKLRDLALQKLETNYSEAAHSLMSAAEFFHTLSCEIKETDLTEEARNLVAYYVEMNEALCLLSSNDKILVEQSSRIYDKLEDAYPNHPLIKFRRGQALGKLGLIDSSIEKFIEAKQLIHKIDSGIINISPDTLPNDDRQHIEKLLPKLLGFQYWIKSSNIDKTNIKARLGSLKAAFSETSVLLNKFSDDISAHNNLIYYAVESLSLSTEDHEMYETQLKSSLELIEKLCIIDTSNDIEMLDTLVKAYSYLNQPEKAKSSALKILSLWEAKTNDVQRLNSEVTMEIVRDAYAVSRQ